MMNLLKKVMFNFSVASKSYEIVRDKFLIPIKPKRAAFGYILFSNQIRHLNPGSISQVAAKLGQLWRALPQDKKKQYNDQYKQNQERIDKQMQVYNDKYVQPFKRVTIEDLITADIDNNQKPKDARERSKLIKQKIDTLLITQKVQYEAQLEKIKTKKKAQQQTLQIPSFQYLTERIFEFKAAGQRSLTELTAQQRKKLKDDYLLYKHNYNRKLQEFGARFNLTLQDLKQIFQRQSRKQARETKIEVANHKHDFLPAVQVIIQNQIASKVKKTKKVVNKKASTVKASTVKTSVKKETSSGKKASKLASTLSFIQSRKEKKQANLSKLASTLSFIQSRKEKKQANLSQLGVSLPHQVSAKVEAPSVRSPIQGQKVISQ